MRLYWPKRKPISRVPTPMSPAGTVGVLAEVAVQLGHEALAEAHDLPVGAALGVEVRAALAAADLHAGEAVLEDLLETEELDDPQVHRGVEAQAALVGPERAVEFDAEGPVDVDLAVVVLPGDLEDELPLGLAEPLDDLGLEVLGPLGQHGGEALEHLVDGLVELGLAGVAAEHVGIQWLDLLG